MLLLHKLQSHRTGYWLYLTICLWNSQICTCLILLMPIWLCRRTIGLLFAFENLPLDAVLKILDVVIEKNPSDQPWADKWHPLLQLRLVSKSWDALIHEYPWSGSCSSAHLSSDSTHCLQASVIDFTQVGRFGVWSHAHRGGCFDILVQLDAASHWLYKLVVAEPPLESPQSEKVGCQLDTAI